MPVKAKNLDVPFQATFTVPDPGAAGADISNYEAWKAPFDLEITKIEYVYHAATVGVDASNTIVTAFKRNNTGTAVASSSKTAVIAKGVITDAGTPDDTTKLLAKDYKLTVDVTCGATADGALMEVTVRYKPRTNASQ